MAGRPEEIVSDREFISSELNKFFSKYNIKFSPLSRESPFLNMIERYHGELKKISKKSKISLQEATPILNALPFSKTPPNCKIISPEKLFHGNNPEMLKIVCDFLEKESLRRKLRSIELRGKNISRFSRDFKIGDIVKFNRQNGSVGFGKVISKRGNKIIEIARIDGTGSTEVHSQHLELVTISEEFLKLLI